MKYLCLTLVFACTPFACTPAASPEPPMPAPSANVASVASAVASAPIASASASSDASTPEAARDKKIKDKFGQICRLERTCGQLWGIDCEAASDGPYYYVKAESLETVSECGGFCRGGRCTNCPPKQWACATY